MLVKKISLIILTLQLLAPTSFANLNSMLEDPANSSIVEIREVTEDYSNALEAVSASIQEIKSELTELENDGVITGLSFMRSARWYLFKRKKKAELTDQFVGLTLLSSQLEDQYKFISKNQKHSVSSVLNTRLTLLTVYRKLNNETLEHLFETDNKEDFLVILNTVYAVVEHESFSLELFQDLDLNL